VKKRGVVRGILGKAPHKVQKALILFRVAVAGGPTEQSAEGRLLAFSFRVLCFQGLRVGFLFG
jgi:hypothetical protein